MKRAFVDTGAWFAYVNRKDPDHRAVKRALEAFVGRLITSSYVFDETVTLCRYRLDHRTATEVGRTLLDPATVDLVPITPGDEREAWNLFLARADQEYSFTDCSSFALMRRLGLDTAIAVDDDFAAEGFVTLPAARP
jgi:predicted nucleic acid-binding protein